MSRRSDARTVPPHAPRSAVVTGGAGGIGRAICADLVGRGYQVVVSDLDGEAARAVAAEVGAVEGVAHDVTDEQASYDVVARARAHAPLGAFVSNAGVGFDGGAADTPSAKVRALVEINLLGAIWGLRAAVDAMREQARDGIVGGDVAVTASLSAHGPVPGLSVYAATKAAVLSLVTSMDSELRGDKIRVHAICPDGVDTPLLDAMEEGGRGSALVHSGGRLYRPEEVAQALTDMFGTRRVYRTLPAWRGVMMRTSGTWPAALMTLEPVMRRQGERMSRKQH